MVVIEWILEEEEENMGIMVISHLSSLNKGKRVIFGGFC